MSVLSLILKIVVRAPRLLWRAGGAMAGLNRGRQRAMRGFESELVRGGVPAELAAELAEAYPTFSLKGLSELPLVGNRQGR